MKFNPVSDIINAFSFRKWGTIARQHDLILIQDAGGKFHCITIDKDYYSHQYATAREAVIDSIHLDMRGYY